MLTYAVMNGQLVYYFLKLYRKKSLTRKKINECAALNNQVLALAYVLDAGLDLTGFKAFKYCLDSDAEFKTAFTKEMLMNGLFFAFGAIGSIAQLVAQLKRPKTINK